MADLTDAQIDAALERGRTARLHEPRAAAARYDVSSGRVIVELTNGYTFAFPPKLAQGLEAATDDQLSHVDILGSGSGLRWDELDVDLSVPSLLAGLLGTRAYLAQQAGRTRSDPAPNMPSFISRIRSPYALLGAGCKGFWGEPVKARVWALCGSGRGALSAYRRMLRL